MVVYTAESPEHEVALMASMLRIRISATANRCARLRLLPSWARPQFNPLRNRLSASLFVIGSSSVLAACTPQPAGSALQPATPFLALRAGTSLAIPEAELSGSLHLQNGCIVFRREGTQGTATAVFDNKSRLSLRPSGFVVHLPEGDLVEGKRYTFGGGGVNSQTPLVRPLPEYCPQNLVLLGTVEKGN